LPNKTRLVDTSFKGWGKRLGPGVDRVRAGFKLMFKNFKGWMDGRTDGWMYGWE
jgi:hypothetical protein